MDAQKSTRLAERFTSVFHSNEWLDGESVSGPGSRRDSEVVKTSIAVLNTVIRDFNINSINDIPCGDFNWIGDVLESNDGLKYAGFDIVAPLIIQNQKSHPKFEFHCLDITQEIPPLADLIFTKELFIHLTFQDIFSSIDNMKASGARYMLAINHFDCQNIELLRDQGGYCRPLNLCSEPFSFPVPIWQYNYYGLWQIN